MTSASDQPYPISVEWDGRYWVAEVPSLQGAYTFARTLRQLDKYVREVIVLSADLPDDAEASLVLDWDIRSGDAEFDQLAKEARQARERRAAEERRAVEATRRVIWHQRARGMSDRDLALLVGASFQRVAQVRKEGQASERSVTK